MRKIIPILSILLLFAMQLSAQPLPPTTPEGNPVPIGQLSLVLLVGSMIILNKKREVKAIFKNYED